MSFSVSAVLRIVEVTISMHVVYVLCSVGGLSENIEIIVLVHLMWVPLVVDGLLANYRNDRPYACDVYALQYRWPIKEL